jgi:F0F1-type ATP synthase membrane subunit b/b'
MAEIRERIIEEGKRRKAALLQEAEAESQRLIASAAKKSEAYLLEAKRKLQEEMVDMATDRALELLPRIVKNEDREKMVASYLGQIG